MASAGFPKHERLKKRKDIESLMERGKRFRKEGIGVTFLILPNETPGAAAAFSVSKRRFKRAVDRNTIKRKMREAYRLQKQELLAQAKNKGVRIHILWVYLDRKPCDFHEISEIISASLRRLSDVIKDLNHGNTSIVQPSE